MDSSMISMQEAPIYVLMLQCDQLAQTLTASSLPVGLEVLPEI